jgi:acyl carrier protein
MTPLLTANSFLIQGNYSMGPIGTTVKEFLLTEFLPGENPDELTETTPLISSGILDSLATLKLSMFLEEQFGIQIDAHELDEEFLSTISQIEQLVESKQ